jgi:hypothetical protein
MIGNTGTSGPLLMKTMIVFVRALLRTPEISRPATASTISTAGTFTVPPSPGGAATASGSVKPNVSLLVRLRDQLLGRLGGEEPPRSAIAMPL